MYNFNGSCDCRDFQQRLGRVRRGNERDASAFDLSNREYFVRTDTVRDTVTQHTHTHTHEQIYLYSINCSYLLDTLLDVLLSVHKIVKEEEEKIFKSL